MHKYAKRGFFGSRYEGGRLSAVRLLIILVSEQETKKEVWQVKGHQILLRRAEGSISAWRTLGMQETFIRTMELKVSSYLEALTSKVKGMSSTSPVSKRHWAIDSPPPWQLCKMTSTWLYHGAIFALLFDEAVILYKNHLHQKGTGYKLTWSPEGRKV